MDGYRQAQLSHGAGGSGVGTGWLGPIDRGARPTRAARYQPPRVRRALRNSRSSGAASTHRRRCCSLTPMLCPTHSLNLPLSACSSPPQSAGAVTYDELQGLTYLQVKGTGLANTCPVVGAHTHTTMFPHQAKPPNTESNTEPLCSHTAKPSLTAPNVRSIVEFPLELVLEPCCPRNHGQSSRHPMVPPRKKLKLSWRGGLQRGTLTCGGDGRLRQGGHQGG